MPADRAEGSTGGDATEGAMGGDATDGGASMPIKRYGQPEDPEVFRWSGGLTWIAHPDERMQRASHAIVVGADGRVATDLDSTPGSDVTGDGDSTTSGDVWLVEPLDFVGLDDILSDLGTVAGVLVLAGLHRRDAAQVAERHDVAVHLPGVVGGLKRQVDAPVEIFEGTLPGTPFRAVPVLDGIPWSEAVLHDEASGTLVAAEVLVTTDRATGRGERLSVGPWARLRPPRAELADLPVERVLVGHGPPVFEDARAVLDHALARSYRGIPGYLVKDLAFMLRAGYVAMRD